MMLKILTLIFLSSVAAAGANTPDLNETPSFCLPMRAASLSSNPACVASYPLEGARKLCLPNEVFAQLRSGMLNRCGDWRGHWRILSPADPASSTKRSYYQFTAFGQTPAADGPLKSREWRFLMALERLRSRLSNSLTSELDSFGVLKSLLLGQEGAASALLHLLGFVHILHATGIHLYALSELVFALSGGVLSLALKLRDRGDSAEYVRPIAVIARGISLFVTLFGWALCGFRASLIRPWCVVACRSLATSLGFRWRRFSPLLIAFGLDILITGQLGIGNLVYTVAVAGGILAISRDSENSAVWKMHFRMALGSWCLAGLLEAWSEGWISFATPLLSLLTLPLYASLIYPLLLLAGLSFATHANHLGASLISIAGNCSRLTLVPLVRATFHAPSIWISSPGSLLLGSSIALIVSALLLAAREIAPRLRWIIPSVAIAIAGLGRPVWAKTLAAQRLPEISQLDVGQGDSALVQSPRFETGLIDTGSARRVSEMSWLRLIGRREISHLDWVAITHFDEDHVGGLSTLARLVTIRCMSTSRGEMKTERGERITARLRALGVPSQALDEGCLPIPYLAPRPEHIKRNNSNMSAFVIPLQNGATYFCAGDAEGTDEERIGRWFSSFEAKERILKISHHGSHTSSSELFLKLAHPTEAWISVGVNNPYGHPHEVVLDRLSAMGIPFRRTDQEGTLMPRKSK